MTIKIYQPFIKSVYISIFFLSSLFIISCEKETETAYQDTSGFSTASVKLSINKIVIQPGNSMEIDITINNFPDTEGGGVNIKYDPELLQVKSITINDTAWDFINQPGNIDNEKGVVSDILVSSYKGISGNRVIATLEIMGNNTGDGNITLEESTLNPFAGGGNKLAVKFLNSEVNVKVVN